MTIATILRTKGSTVVTVPLAARVADAVALLHTHRIGAVLVVDDAGAAVGVLSERDIVAGLHAHGGAILDTPVARCMTSPVVTIAPGDTIAAALETMTRRRFRHLPVVVDGRVAGLVSIGDLVKRRIEEATEEAAMLKDYITAG